MKNNHITGVVGVIVSIVGLLTEPAFSTALTALFPAQEAQIVSSILVLLGLTAAYIGRPVTVPSNPQTTVTVTPATPATVSEKVTP